MNEKFDHNQGGSVGVVCVILGVLLIASLTFLLVRCI